MKWGHRARPGPQVPWIPDSGTLSCAPRLVNKGGATVTSPGLWATLQGAGELVPHLPPRGCSGSSPRGEVGPGPRLCSGAWESASVPARGPPPRPLSPRLKGPGRPGAPTLSHSPSPLERARRGRRAKRLCLPGAARSCPAGSLLAPLILPGSGRAHPEQHHPLCPFYPSPSAGSLDSPASFL